MLCTPICILDQNKSQTKNKIIYKVKSQNFIPLVKARQKSKQNLQKYKKTHNSKKYLEYGH